MLGTFESHGLECVVIGFTPEEAARLREISNANESLQDVVRRCIDQALREGNDDGEP